MPNIGELCDLLVLSKFSDFREFKVRHMNGIAVGCRMLMISLGGAGGVFSSDTCLASRVSLYPSREFLSLYLCDSKTTERNYYGSGSLVIGK